MYKTHFLFFAIVTFIITGVFFSCEDNYENYSTSPEDILSFSSDTIYFDTVLTTINSPIKQLIVYNKNNKPLLISSVRIENQEKTGFKMNVDGMSGTNFENVEIRAKDSLYIMVDVKPDVNGLDEPTSLTDNILFETNGVSQKVVLDAYGQDVYFWKGVTLSSDTIIDKSKPFLVSDSLVIDENVTVQINDGVTFYMNSDAYVYIKGTLKINGTLENPVNFRGKRTDYMIWIPYELVPGQWGGFYFTSGSYDNEFNYANIRNGKFGLYFELSDPSLDKIKIKNSIITNFTGNIISAINCKISGENSEFSNSRYALLNLVGGSYDFTHCTMANFMPTAPEAGWANSSNETLILSTAYTPSVSENEEIPETEYYPITEANFYNSIIYGRSYMQDSRIQIKIDEKKEQSTISYYFKNCLVLYEKENDESFVNCIFNKDPLFVFTKAEYPEGTFYPEFNFMIQENSPARNTADLLIAQQFPLDLKGKNRLEDGEPDIGAYEWEQEIKN